MQRHTGAWTGHMAKAHGGLQPTEPLEGGREVERACHRRFWPPCSISVTFSTVGAFPRPFLLATRQGSKEGRNRKWIPGPGAGAAEGEAGPILSFSGDISSHYIPAGVKEPQSDWKRWVSGPGVSLASSGGRGADRHGVKQGGIWHRLWEQDSGEPRAPAVVPPGVPEQNALLHLCYHLHPG